MGCVLGINGCGDNQRVQNTTMAKMDVNEDMRMDL